MKEALIKLLKVKTIVTLVVTFCLAYGFIAGKIQTDVFMPIVTLIFGSYFTKNNTKEE